VIKGSRNEKPLTDLPDSNNRHLFRSAGNNVRHKAQARGDLIDKNFVLDGWRSNRDDWYVTLRRVAYVR
jgi:hypothetical protein